MRRKTRAVRADGPFECEAIIRDKPRTLLAVYERHSGGFVLRCKICHVGFVGERRHAMARRHLRNAHSLKTRNVVRAKAQRHPLADLQMLKEPTR